MTPRDAASSDMLPRKSFDAEFKAIGEDGSFVLYAACFGNVDRQGDVIESGAFDNLEEFVRDGWIALNHDQKSLPVGYPTAASQDQLGLRIEGQFHSTPEAQAVRTVCRERLSAGKGVKTSVGYVTRDETFDKSQGQMVRRIKRLSVYEASFVNLPANAMAEVQGVKAAGSTASLNRAGVSHARSLIKAGRVNTGSWGFTGADGDALLGEDGDDWTAYGKAHLAVDSSAPDRTKGHWKYPFAKRSGGETKLYTAALRAIASRASQQGKGEISSAASRLLELAKGDEDVEDGDKAAIVSAVRDLLGLATKADVPRSARTRLKAFAEEMHEHGTRTREHAKAMNEHGKAAHLMAKGMKEALKAFGEEDDEDADEEGEEENEGREEAAVERRRERPKRRKEEESEDTADDERPSRRKRSADEDAKAAYLDQLRHRAAIGRRSATCP